MEKQRPLTPGFINKLDRQLLKNNPVTWSIRIHLVLYYSLTFLVLLTLICFIVPDDPRNNVTIYNWVILLSIVSLLSFVLWMIYLLRFNVFKRFGKWNSTDSVKTFFMYFLSVLLMVSWPFVPTIVESIRADRAYSCDELITDINSMNTRLCLLERDSIDTRFSRDTFHIRDSVKGFVDRDVSYNITTGEPAQYNYYFIDTAMLNDKLKTADSVKKLSDSVYVIFGCPEYRFINNYFRYGNDSEMLTSIELFRTSLQLRQPFDTGKVKKELAALFSKYSRDHDRNRLITQYDFRDDMSDPGYQERINDKYDLYKVSHSIGNIIDKKYRWDSETIQVCWRAAYYISLALSLLVLIYRHTTRKTFFLSLLASVVLSILTGLFLATSFSAEGAFFTWMIIYFIIFSVLSALITKTRQRNIVSGIALNLLVFITPFMPLVGTASYYSALREKYYRHEQIENYYKLFENEELHYFISEIAGFVFLVILLATFYQMAYRKWYSLPEQ